MRTLKEIRDNIASTVRDTQISTLIDNYINLALLEIHQFYPWTWLRRKTTFTTVASQEDYNLDEEIDRLLLIRQIATPHKLLYLPDRLFYRLIPDPENLSTGTPYYYRLWEETGFSTQNTSAEKLTIVSSSASDTATIKVVLIGRESTNNLIVSESLSLNGTTSVVSTNTYAIAGLQRVSKSAATTGAITIAGQTSATTFSRIAPEERAPRFKRIGLYPIPSAAVTTYVEYLERLRLLVNDADVPQMDWKWNWLLREGALCSVWGYKQNEVAAALCDQVFQRGLVLMKQEDERNMDYIPVLEPRQLVVSTVIRQNDSINSNFPSYALVPY